MLTFVRLPTEFDNLLLNAASYFDVSLSTRPVPCCSFSEMLHLSTQLQSIYSKAKLTKDGKTYNLEPEITKLMATSRDYDELVWAWVGWRNVTGREMRTLYDRFVQLQNIGAQNIGKQKAPFHGPTK